MWMYALFVVYLYKHSHARQMVLASQSLEVFKRREALKQTSDTI
jgi:hypothetical protein